MSSKQPGFLEAFSRLIAAPSVSCLDPSLDQSNRPVIDLLANWLGDRGFDVDLMPVSDNPEKVNLIARAGEGSGGLVLSGHTDTVPYNEDKWDQDPFTLTERDGRYYGLGTSDMKSFFPIIMDALAEVDIRNLKQPLFILGTCDEESAMTGAKALADSGRSLGRYALIGEPTGLKPIRMHKGVMFESIRITGRSGHSSDPARGLNALEGMNAVINSLIRWRDELQERESNPDFRVPTPTLNFGRIHGGDNPNRICAECELTLDVRLLPHMDIEATRASLRQRVMETVDGTGMGVAFDCIFPGTPGMDTDRNAAIVRYAEELTGEEAGTVAFATEGPYLNAMGMNTVILGPGDIEQAHQANEYLALDRIEPMKQIIQQTVAKFCIEPG
ncbi:MAG: acetylornithine deacetylase [Gammaproteobacteria bacterium]